MTRAVSAIKFKSQKLCTGVRIARGIQAAALSTARGSKCDVAGKQHTHNQLYERLNRWCIKSNGSLGTREISVSANPMYLHTRAEKS